MNQKISCALLFNIYVPRESQRLIISTDAFGKLGREEDISISINQTLVHL